MKQFLEGFQLLNREELLEVNGGYSSSAYGGSGSGSWSSAYSGSGSTSGDGGNKPPKYDPYNPYPHSGSGDNNPPYYPGDGSDDRDGDRLFGHLTDEEIAWVALHPFEMISIGINGAQAQAIFSDDVNNINDAMRHAYFAAVTSIDIGLQKSEEYLTEHENFSGNPGYEMDMHINRVGWQIYKSNPTASKDQILQMIYMAGQAGWLDTKEDHGVQPY